MRLIPQWRRAWRLLSVQAALLLTILSALQADVLPMLQPVIPAGVLPYVTAGFGLAIVLLRVMAQPEAAVPPPAAEAPPAVPPGQAGSITLRCLLALAGIAIGATTASHLPPTLLLLAAELALLYGLLAGLLYVLATPGRARLPRRQGDSAE